MKNPLEPAVWFLLISGLSLTTFPARSTSRHSSALISLILQTCGYAARWSRIETSSSRLLPQRPHFLSLAWRNTSLSPPQSPPASLCRLSFRRRSFLTTTAFRFPRSTPIYFFMLHLLWV